MKLLIITQKVDSSDDILGFFHQWIIGFAERCERVTVICLELGEHTLPNNVHVFSLGKERGVPRLSYLRSLYGFVWQERKNYDAVFVHMNPIYVVLCGVLWRAWGKKIALWYTHKRVDLKLRIAEKLAHIIFTASQKSFRLKSGKVCVVGHGIDTKEFASHKKENTNAFQIVSVGRISPVKDYETLIQAVSVLVEEKFPVQVTIMGDVVLESERAYLARMKSLAQEKHLGGVVTFVGSVPHKQLPEKFAQADILVSASGTGSVDKAILEAMACGVPTVTSNEAFADVFDRDATMLMFPAHDIQELVQRIKYVYNLGASSRAELGERLRAVVVTHHNIENVIPKMLDIYETSR